MTADCYTCRQEAALATTTHAERIWVGTHWRVAHAIGCALPGWLVVVPRRHVTALAALDVDEGAELGRLQIAASRALRELLGCEKTYLMQFAEAEGFSHAHVHVVPRAADLPEDRLGPDVFWYLRRPGHEQLDAAAMDLLAERLAPMIAREMA